MPTLYETLTWTIDEPDRRRYYLFHVLANATRVPVHRASMPSGDPHAHYDETRVVICVAAPDGSPYFYVDRTNDPMRPQPALVVAANGGRSAVSVLASLIGVELMTPATRSATARRRRIAAFSEFRSIQYHAFCF